MDLKITAVLMFAAVLLLAAAYRWLPAAGHEQLPRSAVPIAEIDQLKAEVARLDRQHKAAAARLAELEEFFAASKLGPASPMTLQEDGPEEVEVTAAEQVRPRPRRGSEPDIAQIEEAGMTAGEFAAIEEQARSLYLEGVEAEWARRRDNYLKGAGDPDSNQRLRENLGDDAYDRYLYASGRSNRVRLRQVLPGSAAERAGLTSEDVVLSYGDQRVFSFDDLRRLTYEGEVGEQVLLEVQRSDGSVSQLVMPRGPMGISGYRGWREVPD